MSAQEFTIRYEPHYHTLTESGKSHFTRPVDAIAEFVDNAIQACKGVKPKREITISLFQEKKDNFLMIADNGKGLNVKEIEAFATFSLDQETRRSEYLENRSQEDSTYSTFFDTNNSSYISKFGVGSKQAGFYLGDRITVISKPRSERKIHKFVLSVNEMKQKAKAKDSVYQGKGRSFEIHETNFFHSDEIESTSRSLLQEIAGHQQTFPDQHAIFIIKLFDHITDALVKDSKASRLYQELGEIYYFHLHPDHSLESLVLYKFGDSLVKESNQKLLRTSKKSENYSSDTTELCLFYKEFKIKSSGTPIILKINDYMNYIALCIDKAKDLFLFQLLIPDDRKGSVYGVLGFVLYYPFIDGEDTLPVYSPDTMALLKDHKIEAKQAVDGKGENKDDEDDEDEDDEEEEQSSKRRDPMKETEDHLVNPKPFLIFWQNRFVPEANVPRLHFYPDSETIKMNVDVKKQWKRKVVGFLFLDWNFRSISNNKLKITLKPEEWVLHSNIAAEPRQINSKFEEWMSKCYNTYDREYIFREKTIVDKNYTRFRIVEIKRQANTNSTSSTKNTTIDITIAEGDEIKWKINQCPFFAKVLAFQARKVLGHSENVFVGTGSVVFQRLPIETYGGEESIVPLDYLDLRDFKATKKEINKIGSIEKIIFRLFETESNEYRELKDGDTIICGKTYYKMGVQLIDNLGNVVFGLPHIPDDKKDRAKSRYTVGMNHVYRKAGKESSKNTENLLSKKENDRKDYGEHYEPWGFDPIMACDREYRTMATHLLSLSSFYYSFYTVKLEKLGTIEFKVTVKLPQNKIVIKNASIKLNVRNPSIHHMNFIDGINPFENFILRLGDCLPSFGLSFLDESNSLTPYAGKMKIQLKSVIPSQVSIATNKKYINYVKEMEAEDYLMLDDRVWQLKAIAFSSKEVIYKKTIQLQLQFFHSSSLPSSSSSDAEMICEPFQFSVTLRPGNMHHLGFVQPESTSSSSSSSGSNIDCFKNDQIIPLFHIACFDEWNNRTFPPDSEKWELEFEDHHGPLEYVGSEKKTRFEIIRTGEMICVNSMKSVYTNNEDEEGANSSSEGGKEEVQNFYLIVNGERMTNRVFTLPFKIFPSFIPQQIKIYHNGKDISGTTIDVSPGDILSNLSFAILNDDGSTHKITKYSPEFQRAFFYCSWINEGQQENTIVSPTTGRKKSNRKKRKQSQFPLDCTLPNIEITSENIAEIPTEYEVEIEWGGIAMNESFQVRILVKNAVKWKIEMSHSFMKDRQCIRNNDPNEFMKKVAGITIEDGHGNIVQAKDVIQQFHPKLEIYRILDANPMLSYEEDDQERGGSSSRRNELNDLKAPSFANYKDSMHFFSSEKNESSSSGLSLMSPFHGESSRKLEKMFEIPMKLGRISLKATSSSSSSKLKKKRNADEMEVDNDGLDLLLGSEDEAGEGSPSSDSLIGFVLQKKDITFHELDTTSLLFRAVDDHSQEGSETEKGSLLPDELRVKIGKGRPHGCCLSFPSTATTGAYGSSNQNNKNNVNADRPSRYLSVDISRYSQISNLLIHIIDESSQGTYLGNYADLYYYSSIKNVNLEIYEKRKQKLIYTQKSIKVPFIRIMSLDYPFHELFDELQSIHQKNRIHSQFLNDLEQNIIRFECKITYDYQDRRIQLPAAELICHLAELNNIKELQLALLAPPSSSRTTPTTGGSNNPSELIRMENGNYELSIRAGESLPAMKLSFLTDDGQPFLPEINRLEFKIHRRNILQNLELENHQNTDDTTNSHGGDGILPLRSLKNLSSAASSSSSSVILFDELFEIIKPSSSSSSSSLNGMENIAYYLLQPKEFFNTTLVNSYDIKIIYNENRPSLMNILPESFKKISLSFQCNIIENKFTHLFIRSEIHLLKKSVRFSLDKTLESNDLRTIGKEIRVYLQDQYGNLCKVPAGYDIIVQIVPSLNNPIPSTRSIPRLAPGSDGDADRPGILYGKFYNSERIGCYFERLQLDTTLPSSSSSSSSSSTTNLYIDGEYRLQFSLVKKLISHRKEEIIFNKFIPFQLVSNINKLNLQRNLEEQLKKKLFALQEYERIQKENQLCEEDLQKNFQLLTSSASSSSSSSSSASSLIPVEHLDNLNQLQNDQKQLQTTIQNTKASVARVAKKKGNSPDPMKLNAILNKYPGKIRSIGLVVDLAFVDNLEEARIISSSMMKAMDAIVVETSEEAVLLHDGGIKCIALDQILPFKVVIGSENRLRNEAERSKKKMPIGIFRPKSCTDAIIPGNPRLMINLLQLQPENEHLRDTLFWDLLRNTILIDDFHSAIKYRREFIREGRQPPSIFTMNGDRLDTSAVLMPSSPLNEGVLPFVFGQLSLVDSTLIINAEKVLEMVNKRIDLLEKKAAKEKELSTHVTKTMGNQSIEQIKREIADLENRLANNLK